MRLMRVGPVGQEVPTVSADGHTLRDLRGLTHDIDGASSPVVAPTGCGGPWRPASCPS